MESAAAVVGAIAVYTLLAVVVLLSAPHPQAWAIWLVAVPAGLLALAGSLAAHAACRRRKAARLRAGRGDAA
jgi:hypothetical protein